MSSIYLSPTSVDQLGNVYNKAVSQATDLIITTAFLTEWPISKALCDNCKSLLVLIGTDFGLTRKNALKQLVKWVPNDKGSCILAVPTKTGGCFHPKFIAWKDKKDNYNLLIGSSNLTSAAFSKNYEANMLQVISKNEFENIKIWARDIGTVCQVITPEWIKSYHEAKMRGCNKKSSVDSHKFRSVIELQIPISADIKKRIAERRKQQEAFSEIKQELVVLTKKCASGKMQNSDYWNNFWALWSKHPSRFQGSGLQFSGKYANWKEACQSLLNVINGPSDIYDLDIIVQEEINFLKNNENPVKGAWFSEMLCHFFPQYYPILNDPIKKWLKHKKWTAHRGSSEGGKYIELSRMLRNTINQNNEILNLAELDNVIWAISKKLGLI